MDCKDVSIVVILSAPNVPSSDSGFSQNQNSRVKHWEKVEILEL